VLTDQNEIAINLVCWLVLVRLDQITATWWCRSSYNYIFLWDRLQFSSTFPNTSL